MPFRRRRPLMRAAMIGGTAYVAGKAGQRAASREEDAADQEQSQDAPPAEPEAQQGGGAPAGSDLVTQLTDLKGLVDSGVLTQAEFEAAKAKLLA